MSAELTKEPAQWDGWTEDARSKPAAKFWPRMGTWMEPLRTLQLLSTSLVGRSVETLQMEQFLRSRSFDVLSEASVVPRNAAAVLGVKSGVGGHRFHAVFKP